MFKKRKYNSIKELLDDLKYLVKNIKHIRNSLPKEFKERIMLAETQVNQCRYCNFIHTKIALLNGFKREELDNLIKHCPKDQINAILYTQYYTEKEGKVEEDIRNKIIKEYGKERVDEIEYYIRLMKLGNYIGNTFDYFIYKIQELLKR